MTTQAELVSVTEELPRRRWHELARTWADYLLAALLLASCGVGWLTALGILALIEWVVS